jgi:CDP-glucose 4,6-dehydratase
MVAKWGQGSSWELDKNNNPHEAGFLKLDCSKAATKLKWEPKWNLEFTLDKIVNWQQSFLTGEDMKKICLEEIALYQNSINE